LFHGGKGKKNKLTSQIKTKEKASPPPPLRMERGVNSTVCRRFAGRFTGGFIGDLLVLNWRFIGDWIECLSGVYYIIKVVQGICH